MSDMSQYYMNKNMDYDEVIEQKIYIPSLNMEEQLEDKLLQKKKDINFIDEVLEDKTLQKKKDSTLTENNEMDFSNIRVIQKNLVYIICIPQKYADETILSRNEFFGQFGKIKKIVVNKRASVLESTASAYITYSTEEEAKSCIQEVDESILDGKMLKCTYGTTKYCSFYLKNYVCQNIECMYLHECKPQKDLLTKDEMGNSKHKLHDFEIKNKNKNRIGRKCNFEMLNELFKHKPSRVFKAPDRILFEPLDFTN